VLLAAMSWNNLPAFPYLHGYSVATLDRLLGEHGFERAGFEGDVLTRLSDDRTKVWAMREEQVLKVAWRMLARVAATAGRPDAYPWIDVYYRKR
jgi:hypothetical protein